MGWIQRHAAEKGLTMIDASKPLEVTVTPADVRGATAQSPTSCAIARAVRREHPEVRAAYVFRSTVWLEDDEHLVRYALPESAKSELVAFDRGAKFYPGKYHLPLANRRTKAQRKAHAAAQRRYYAKTHEKAKRPVRKKTRQIHRTEGIRLTEADE